VMEEHVGVRRWCSTGRWPQQTKEAGGSVLQWFLAVDGGSVAGLAWLRGAREQCAVVGALALGVEVDDERQSGVGLSSTAVAGRGENGFSLRPTA
jgi:hypothetical protein